MGKIKTVVNITRENSCFKGYSRRLILVKSNTSNSKNASYGWGCRIHRLHLCRRVKLPQWLSCI